MGVVIVQSRATAHVYRIFGALVVLLVVMALAVAAFRFRAGRQDATPYGALSSLNAKPDQAPPSLPAAPRPATTSPAPVQAATSPPPAAPEAAAADGAPKAARVIALDKAAAGSAVPQPAPPAVVEAAARAAAAPPPPAPAPTVAPLPAPPAVVAVAQPATNPAPPPPPGGRININTASADQLNRLGAGMIGGWIVRHRPYRSVGDLLSRRVLKARDFNRIQGTVTTD